MDNLTLPRELANQLISYAQASPEEEICGLISKTETGQLKNYPIHNAAPDKSIRYEMDPKELISTMRKMREQNETLFIIYHSHPNSEAHPSETDIREANYKEAIYLIISLNVKGIVEIRAFTLLNKHPQELRLEVN
ncbi:MAG: M67 family metallopeptidase [Gammaproteobacteria bacterium]|nr:M67 family metallopeptidase [Gammaproteobacteria bacterium]MDH5694860.1 M67 family metallopeptidase [Gammaproteobacteria bacterium]